MKPDAQTEPELSHTDVPAAGSGDRMRGFALRLGPAVTVAAVFVIILWLAVPGFLTTGNILNLLQEVSILGVVSVGMVFVVLTAGIDLSVGSILALTTVTFAMAMHGGLPSWAALIVALAVGGAVGLVNGVGVTVFNIQPFVMTLATLAIAAGVALTISNGSEIFFSSNSGLVSFLGIGGIGSFPGEFVVFAGVAIAAALFLRYIPFGRYVYAVGGSAEAARLSGIRTKRVLLGVYVIAGVCAALGGVMTAAQLQAGEPTAGSLTNLQAIAAVVIGGVSLFGGRGTVSGGVVGAFVLAIIANVLVLLGVSPYQSQIVQGVVIIGAVLIGLLSSREVRQRLAMRAKSMRVRT
jgi:ribose transport system permease protein